MYWPKYFFLNETHNFRVGLKQVDVWYDIISDNVSQSETVRHLL